MAAAKVATRRTQTGNREADDMQRLAQEVARRFNACPIFSGVHVEAVDFTAGVERLVNHGLGREPLGYLVTRSYGSNVCTGVGEGAMQPDDTTKQIRLVCPLTCRIDLWVFG